MYLCGILERQRAPIRELTDSREDWNAQPQCIYLIQDSNDSKVSNKYPEPSFDDENRLYELEEVYSIDQTSHVNTIRRKSKMVHVYVVASIKSPKNGEGGREKLLTNLDRKNTKQPGFQKDREQLI